MRKLFPKLMYIVSITAVVCAPALCAPSGLNVIPTADVLDKSVISIETESDGTGHPWGSDCDSFALLQIGVGHGMELGLDRSTSGSSDYWINFKWQLRNEDGTMPAFAVGTQGISDEERAQPFAVATKSLGESRVHMGLIDIEHKTRWMFGVDHPLNSRLTFQADYINGDGNTTSFGMAVNLNESISMTLARLLGNSGDVDDGYMVNIAYSMPLK